MLSNFFVGATVCFVSTLPFGPINLTVARTTLAKNHWRGLEVAVAAALVETVQVWIVVRFGLLISDFLFNNLIFRALVASIFLLLGLFVFYRRPSSGLGHEEHAFGSELRTGLVVAAVNPQAFPFWIVALAALADYTSLVVEGPGLLHFLAGVLVGKVLALSGFVAASHYLKAHLDESSRLVNHVLGAVLILIGLLQWIRILSEL